MSTSCLLERCRAFCVRALQATLVSSQLQFVHAAVAPALPSFGQLFLLRSLLELGLCPPKLLTSPAVKSVFPRLLVEALGLGKVGDDTTLLRLLDVMGETKLTQLGLSLIDGFASQGFGVDACVLSALVFLRRDAPALCRTTFWKDVVSTGVTRSVTVPAGACMCACRSCVGFSVIV